MSSEFTRAEAAVLRAARTPERIQRLLDDGLTYNKEPDGPTCRSPRLVLRDRVAHCMEAAMLAASALRFHGDPPLIVSLEAVHDDDHVIAVFQRNGGWGAIGKSNYAGLRYREPVYRSLRELAMSYFEHYYNLKGEKTLRAFSRPVNLARFDHIGWMTAEGEVWAIPEYLCEIRHYPLLTPAMTRSLGRVDRRLFNAGLVGSVKPAASA